MKRSSINKRSSKRAAREREAHPIRLAFVTELGRCELCGKRREVNRLCVHEILPGAFRVRTLTERCATLVVCALECHPQIQLETKPRQLARLYLSRQSDYSLKKFCALWCRASTAVTQVEVDAEIALLLSPHLTLQDGGV